MKTYFTIILFILSFSFLSTNAQIERPIGTNLTGIVDWSSEYVFVDVFKQSREWIAHEYGFGVPWSSNVEIPLGPNGYPLEIPYNDGVNPPQAIRALMFFGELEGKYPGGNYRLIASGSGQISLWGAASGTFSCPVDTFVTVDSSFGGIALEIEISLASDPVRDIHFVMPGFENTFEENPFNPALLDFIEDFQVLRFMDWMETNNSPNVSWADRNTLDYYSQTLGNGVSYEYIIELCNLMQKDPWICIPHQADDQFIVELAHLFRDSLDSNLNLYIEYSNEVWNSIFAQTRYADSMGNVLGYSGNPWEQGWKFYAKRTADMFHIFETEFQDTSRLVKVISSQAANSWVTNYIIERFEDPFYNPNQVKADAIAIAPYFGGAVADNIGNAGLINSITVSEILDSLELSLHETFNWMDETQEVANDHNLEMIAYDGGQHLVASWLYHNDTVLVNKLIAANLHPRMENIYCDYFNYWYDSTQAGVFAQFSSHAVSSKYGSWGIKEFMEDTLVPKYLGLQNCVFSFNTDTTSTSAEEFFSKTQTVKAYPIPAQDGIVWIEHDFRHPEVALFDLQGKEIPFKVTHSNPKKLHLRVSHYQGMAIVLLKEKGQFASKKVLFVE